MRTNGALQRERPPSDPLGCGKFQTLRSDERLDGDDVAEGIEHHRAHGVLQAPRWVPPRLRSLLPACCSPQELLGDAARATTA